MKRMYNSGGEESNGLTELHSGNTPEAPRTRYKQDFLPMPCEAGEALHLSFSMQLHVDEPPLRGTQEL